MPNNCLEDDKESFRRIAKALGKSEEWLKRGRGGDVWNWRGIRVENQPQRVTAINWDCDEELSGEIPKELGQLTGLQSLYLHSNGLSGEIPKELGQLTGLGYLDLYTNKLSGEIPKELGQLTSLGYLDLPAIC